MGTRRMVLGIAVVAAVGAIATFVVARDDGSDPAADVEVADPASDESTGADLADDGTELDRSPFPGEFSNDSFELVDVWTTPSGVDVRVHRAMLDADACGHDVLLRVGVSTELAVGIVEARFAPVGQQGPAVVFDLVGIDESDLVQVVVVRASESTTSVRASFHNGSTDEVAPIHGFAVFASRRGTAPPGPITIETLGADGEPISSVDLEGPIGLIGASHDQPCDVTPPPAPVTTASTSLPPVEPQTPIELPPPGDAQPDDPTGARAAVIEVVERYNDGSRSPEDRAADVDDPTGVAEAHHQVDLGYAELIDRARGHVIEVTFRPATEATVIYEVFIDGASAIGVRIGRAVQVDGVWKVARETACADIALAGVICA